MKNPGVPRGRSPTLANVASRANVSISTAARVLRNSDYPVDKDLAEAVRTAAREIGYVPNMLARSLRSGGPTMVGLIVGDMLDPYYGEIADAVTLRAEEGHSMAAIVSNMQRDPLLELKHCQQLWEHRCAGLILAGGGFDQWSHFDRLTDLVQQMTSGGVVVATLSPRGLDTPCFCVDNEEVGRVMAGHLVANGHRRVGILLGPPLSEVTQQRLRGASRALAAAGAGFQLLHADYTRESGARAVQTLLERDPNLTAFVVGAASMAMGVVSWLRETGRSVPRDVSVIGVGSARMTDWMAPSLTTVDTQLATCGRAALDYIAAKVKNQHPEVPRMGSVPVTIVPGGTVAKIG